MKIALVRIRNVPEEWQIGHAIRALEINGRSLVIDVMARWSRDCPREYKKILDSLKMVGTLRRVQQQGRVRKDRYNRPIYEIKAPNCPLRLFFFYTPDSEEVIICTNGFLKSKLSAEEQEVHFYRAYRLYQTYLDECVNLRLPR